jgi:hypothetical protein
MLLGQSNSLLAFQDPRTQSSQRCCHQCPTSNPSSSLATSLPHITHHGSAYGTLIHRCGHTPRFQGTSNVLVLFDSISKPLSTADLGPA